MEEEQKGPKVWAEIAAFKGDRPKWIEVIKKGKKDAETLEGLLTHRLNQLKGVGLWDDLRVRHCRFENGRNHFGDWEKV